MKSPEVEGYFFYDSYFTGDLTPEMAHVSFYDLSVPSVTLQWATTSYTIGYLGTCKRFQNDKATKAIYDECSANVSDMWAFECKAPFMTDLDLETTDIAYVKGKLEKSLTDLAMIIPEANNIYLNEIKKAIKCGRYYAMSPIREDVYYYDEHKDILVLHDAPVCCDSLWHDFSPDMEKEEEIILAREIAETIMESCYRPESFYFKP